MEPNINCTYLRIATNQITAYRKFPKQICKNIRKSMIIALENTFNNFFGGGEGKKREILYEFSQGNLEIGDELVNAFTTPIPLPDLVKEDNSLIPGERLKKQIYFNQEWKKLIEESLIIQKTLLKEIVKKAKLNFCEKTLVAIDLITSRSDVRNVLAQITMQCTPAFPFIKKHFLDNIPHKTRIEEVFSHDITKMTSLYAVNNFFDEITKLHVLLVNSDYTLKMKNEESDVDYNEKYALNPLDLLEIVTKSYNDLDKPDILNNIISIDIMNKIEEYKNISENLYHESRVLLVHKYLLIYSLYTDITSKNEDIYFYRGISYVPTPIPTFSQLNNSYATIVKDNELEKLRDNEEHFEASKKNLISSQFSLQTPLAHLKSLGEQLAQYKVSLFDEKGFLEDNYTKSKKQEIDNAELELGFLHAVRHILWIDEMKNIGTFIDQITTTSDQVKTD